MKISLIQIFGIFNIFFVHLITTIGKKNKTLKKKKISKLKLLSYIINSSFELINIKKISSIKEITISLLDGKITINKFKLILIKLIIKLVIIKLLIKNDLNSEILIILLTNIFGITLLFLSHDLLLTLINWELKNLTIYLLISLNSMRFSSSLSASIKYLILSALSTGILILGLIIIYLITGSTHYDNIIANFYFSEQFLNLSILNLAFIFLLLTFLFKLSVVPFHNWAPDLYENLNLNITKWMIILPKITILNLILKNWELPIQLNLIIKTNKSILLITAILSMIIGTIGLIQQWKIKRFIAYSSISHIGWILLALILNAKNTYIIYIIIYIITTLNLFSILKKYKSNIISITQLIGLFKFNPYLSLALTINIFSLAGVYLLYILDIIK